MKLELKHLAPYLPYGITFDHFDEEREIRSICVLSSINIDEITLINSHYEYTHSIGEVKPILRPMSDLPGSELMTEWKKEHNIEYLPLHKNLTLETEGYSRINVLGYPLDFITQMIENKFDVFGLIPEGLAIDINTLEGGVKHEA